jgi:hypothetical protein
MDRRALELLELPAILERLAGLAVSEPGKGLALALIPSADPDEVADRDDPGDRLLVGEHRQVADPAVGHHRHALVDRRVRAHVHDRRRHDLADGRRPLVPSLARDTAEVVTLGDDPGEPLAFPHEQGADVAFDHLCDRLVHGRRPVDPESLAALRAEDVGDVAHRLPVA